VGGYKRTPCIALHPPGLAGRFPVGVDLHIFWGLRRYSGVAVCGLIPFDGSPSLFRNRRLIPLDETLGKLWGPQLFLSTQSTQEGRYLMST
jgi:hypothetical protein